MIVEKLVSELPPQEALVMIAEKRKFLVLFESTNFSFFPQYHGGGDAMQAFYAEFGELMMRQPVIGLDFQSYLPTAIVPYMLLLVFNVFNRYAFPLCHCCLCLRPFMLVSSVFNRCAFPFCISACVWDFSLSARLQQVCLSMFHCCLCLALCSFCWSSTFSPNVFSERQFCL